MNWDQIDTRLETLRRDRRWLAEKAGYTYDSLRNTLSPSAAYRRTDRMLATLRRVIEDEEVAQGLAEKRPTDWIEVPAALPTGEIAPGIFQIFRTDAELDRADRASRVAGSESLVEFCRDCIFTAADELLAQEQAPAPFRYPPSEPGHLRAAEEPEAGK